MSLAGKVALVTGASRGIGRASALALAKEGATVVVNYNSNASLADEVVQSIGSDRAVAIQADVSDLAQATSLIDQVVGRYSRIDILCLNAAALQQNGSLADVTEADFDRLFSTNVKAPFFLLKHAAPHVPDGGRVLLFSTSLVAMSTITPNYLLYVATKGAVEQMTKVLAKDLGRRGVTVNCVAPGPTATDGFFEGKTDAIVKHIEGFAPAKRLGQAEEIANAITLLVKPEASWINGQIVRVNGGATVG